MTHIEEQIARLEEAVAETEAVIHSDKAHMEEGSVCGFELDYKCGLVLVVPVLVALVLYFLKPAFVMKKVRSKQVVCLYKVLMYAVLSLIFACAVLFGLKYFAVL